MNIKSSLTIKFTTIVAAILLGFSIFTYQFSYLFRKNVFTNRLKTVSEKMVMSYLEEESFTPEVLHLLYAKQLNRFPNERLMIADEKYALVFASHPIIAAEIDLLKNLYKNPRSIEINKGDTDIVAYSIPYAGKNFFVVNSAVDISGYEKLNFLKSILLIFTIACIVLAALSGWNFSRNALEPINDVIEEVSLINESNLNQRVSEGKGKDEIANLAVTFNKMLARIEKSFMMQKLFVANASHEFRTPLTAMKGQIEVLLLKDRTKEEYINGFISILEDIESQIELINGLSELAKANADFPNIYFTPISLVEVIMEAQEDLLKRKPNFKISLDLEDIPEDESLIETLGDFSLLKSVFINLIDNACKFSPTHHCMIRVSFDKDTIVTKVIDQGPGIDSHDFPNIFEPFFRSNDTRKIHGYGIGLSLVKKTIEVHKGNIKVISAPKQGTTMIVTLFNSRKLLEQETLELDLI